MNFTWETTTTSGTGNLTLAGAKSALYKTINASVGVGPRFPYTLKDTTNNVWETGIGYLSASTTMVRELVLSNSSGTLAALTLGGATVDVYISATSANVPLPALGFSSLSSVGKFAVGANTIRPNSTLVLTADRTLWAPFVWPTAKIIDTIGCAITTGAGTGSNKLHLGLYDCDPNTGEPASLLLEKTNLLTNSAVVVSGTFTERLLMPGIYWAAFWSDSTPTLRAADGGIVVPSHFATVNGTALINVPWFYKSAQAGLTSLPATGNADTANKANAAVPMIFLGHS